MTRLTTHSLHMMLRPFAALRQRARARSTAQPYADREPEQLERIASYARAGYFNMGYTFEMFPLVGDLPPN